MAIARPAGRICQADGAVSLPGSVRRRHSCLTTAAAYRCSEVRVIIARVILDRHQRPLRNLRLSVTDRCNLRCSYCMPEAEYAWLPREDILDFEELERLVGVFVSLGVNKVRLTGGEPLLRRGLTDLVRRLAARPGIDDLAMTTNGVLLAAQAAALKEAGLHRITVSLDTLDPGRFKALTRYDELDRV